MVKRLILAAILLLGVSTYAHSQTVNQGNGSSSVVEWRVNYSANRAGSTTEVCVTNAAGGTTITAITSRKAIELQNLGPNALYCTVSGTAPLSTGALGRKVDASGGVWSLDAGPSVAIKCIAATAAQVTPACTQVTQLR